MGVHFVFLDRDGTINRSPPAGEYLADPEAVELLPGAGEAIRRLNEAGKWVGVVTNQRGVALGTMTSDQVAAVNARLEELLALEGARLDGIWVCPHEEGACDCRKPRPGLLLRAQAEHPRIDFSQAAMIGDTERDVGAGRALGLTTVRLGAGRTEAEHQVEELVDAVALMLR